MIARADYLLEAFKGTLSGGVAKGKWYVTSPCNSELGAQDVRVRLRRPRRDSQALGDLEVRTSLGDQLDHLALTGSELLLVGHGGSDVGSDGRFCLSAERPILLDYTLRSMNEDA
jgi:hypothetical protein